MSVLLCVCVCLFDFVCVAPVISFSVLLCGCVGLCLVVHVCVRADVVTACVRICVSVRFHVCMCVFAGVCLRSCRIVVVSLAFDCF